MQKYLLYRKGLRMADIDQDDVKRGAQQALFGWIERSRLMLETDGSEAFTFRFAEMCGYREGYEGSCYWISFWAHRPYVNKEGHYSNRTHFDLWVYWDQDRWNVLSFTKSTLDNDFLILLQSWKKEEKPTWHPALREEEKHSPTTIDDIYVDVLQRLQTEHVRLGVSLIYEEAEHIEEDENGNEIYVPAREVQVWFVIEDAIKLYEGNKIVLPNSAFDIDDLEEVIFEVEEYHPSLLDVSLSFEQRIKQTTNLEIFCSLVNELADMGCEVTTKKEDKDGASQVRVLDVEYINNDDGLDNLASFLSRGKYRVHYLPLPEDGEEEETFDLDEVGVTDLPTYMSFWVRYNREAVCYRVNHGQEDALIYYRTSFLPKVRAARANDEIPSLLF